MVALVSETITNLQVLLQKLQTAATTVGLTVNQSTQWRSQDLQVGGGALSVRCEKSVTLPRKCVDF